MNGRGLAQKSKDVIFASYDILEEIRPASVRSVCYQLFNRRLISSMSKGETQKVSRLLVWARENGVIPWDWSEKGTVRGILSPLLDEFAVTFAVKHGFDSATSIHNVAVETGLTDRPLIALYVGDFDPSGLCMSEKDLPARIERYGANVSLPRIALTQHDVSYGGLPSFPAATKSKDPRHKWFVENYGSQCWELDALSPPVLRDRVRQAILSHIDFETWNHCKRVEDAELASLRSFKWGQVFSDQSQNSGEGAP